MSKTMKMEFLCPNGHQPILNKDKSNENWEVRIDPCPECGEQLKLYVDEKDKPNTLASLQKKEGQNNA